MLEPVVAGRLVSVYAKETFNALTSFVENIVVYSFQVALKPELGIFEIPAAKRDPMNVKRFELWHPIMGGPEWNLYYSENDFL